MEQGPNLNLKCISESDCLLSEHCLGRKVRVVLRRKSMLTVLLLALAVSVPYFMFLFQQQFAWERAYELDYDATPSMRVGRFSEPAESGDGFLYSDMFAVHVGGYGFGIYATTRASSLGSTYDQVIGGLEDAGTLTFTPLIRNSVGHELTIGSAGIRPIEFNLYHGTYEEFWPIDSGEARLSASVWVGYPYAKFVASFSSATTGNASGLYSLSFHDNEPNYFLVPTAERYTTMRVSGFDRINLFPDRLGDNFIILGGGKFGMELITFEKRPTSLVFDPTQNALQIGYALDARTAYGLVKMPPTYVGFLRTAESSASPNQEEFNVARRLAHSALSFPTSIRTYYTVKADHVDVRNKYNFDYSNTNDWGLPSQPIMPLPYETNSSEQIDFTLNSLWAPISYVPANSANKPTFSLKFTIPPFELPTTTSLLIDGSPEARTIYSSIDYIENTQNVTGEWDGDPYHDGRVVTHLLLIYPLLNTQYKAKVARISGRTLTSYYSNGIAYNPATDAYRFSEIGKQKWENDVDIGALTAWLFYATALYTRYVDPTFTINNFGSIRKIERTAERVVDWSGLSWANPDPDTNGELLIETAMTFLLYYHLADQDSNVQEMDRAQYFASLTENFLLRVFEQPPRYWPQPNFVGLITPDKVRDHVDSPDVQWNWANVIWGMWTPIMAHSYTHQYIDEVKQTALEDWQWNDPMSAKFFSEYLNFNMILLYMHEPEATKNAQIILDWSSANKTEEYFQTALARAEQAAQIGYTLLKNTDERNPAIWNTSLTEQCGIFSLDSHLALSDLKRDRYTEWQQYN